MRREQHTIAVFPGDILRLTGFQRAHIGVQLDFTAYCRDIPSAITRQNRVKFDADADLDAYVAAAVKTVKSDVLDDAPAGVTHITGGKIYDAVDKALPGSYSLTKGETDFDEACIKKADTTKTVLYWVKAGNLTEAQVLTLVADDMNMADYDEVCAENGKYYDITYNGAASIVKATATSEAGDTYNAYVVAVSVTQSVGDQVNDKT